MQIKTLVLLVAFSWNALAWGPIGHRAIGLIADANLSPTAKTGIAQLLNRQTLADVANWADVVKVGPYYSATKWYHFDSVPDRVTYLQSLAAMTPEQKALGGLVEVILASKDIIKASNRTLSEKSDAIKFITHFIGDLHQPLHTGRPEDRGGNDIPVNWFGSKMNLHSVWDSGIILTGHKDIIKPQMSLEQASIAYAQYLVKAYTTSRFVYQSTDTETWMNESISLRAQAYDQLYNKDQNRYLALNTPQVDSRVLMAGLRLADTINQIFAGLPIPPKETLFKQQIEKIVGSLTKLINLRP